MNNKVIGIVATIALVLGIVGISVGDKTVYQTIESKPVGAIPGTDIYQHITFHSGLSKGGTRYATSSTATAYTLTNTEMTNRNNDVSYIDWTVNVNTTLTTQATSSMSWLGKVAGDEKSFWFRNASTTAAASATFAAGTGVDLQDNEDSADLALLGLDLAKLTFIRKADTDVLLVIDEYTEAD